MLDIKHAASWSKIDAMLRIQRLSGVRDMLSEMSDNLRKASDSEADSTLSMRLEMLRLETRRLADDYNHESNRVAFTASVNLEDK